MTTQELPPYFDPLASATDDETEERRSRSRGSISPSLSPRAVPALSRCVSTASSTSTRSSSVGRQFSGYQQRASSGGFGQGRPSVTFGDDPSGDFPSKRSSAGKENSQPLRRGYVRPQGTHFARSAQHRDSVMSLGSIAHLQYYFARTGLLDGKGGRLAKNKSPLGELDIAAAGNAHIFTGSPDGQNTYPGNLGSPDFMPSRSVILVDSPIDEEGGDAQYGHGEAYEEDFEYYSDEEHPEMLHPHVSTYNPRLKPLLPPPSLVELKAELQGALEDASKALSTAKQQGQLPPPMLSQQSPREPPNDPLSPNRPNRRRSDSALSSPASPAFNNRGWYELQGMHILDVLTLAIRAAKLYYTAHENPARLTSIKSEKTIRSELLSVMDILKRMATRSFAGGMRSEERETMEAWVDSVWAMLKKEAVLEEEEAERMRSWEWLDNSKWAQPNPNTVNIKRELAFLTSMDTTFLDFPAYEPTDFTNDPTTPSDFLRSLQNGLKLVELHNCIVKKSKRPFGAIPTYHTDTAKPYRMADNLRFWLSATKLRWDLTLKLNVMALVNGVDGAAWKEFEDAIWRWTETVRAEMAEEIEVRGHRTNGNKWC